MKVDRLISLSTNYPRAAFASLVIAFATLFLFCSPRSVSGQTITATLTGTVSDSTGAAVPGATVTVMQVSTGTTRTTQSNAEGIYTVTQLQPETYTISVSHTGFSTTNRTGVVLQINQSANISIVLQIGSANETIQVSDAAPLLDTESVSLGTVVDQKQVTDLPLNGRQFSQLLQLVPGVVPVSVGQSLTPSIGVGSISPGIDGQSNRANLTFIDGVLATDNLFSSFTVNPSIDAIQSFQVQTHAADAQFGQSTGGTINVATKAGTNQFHGTGYEFFRNQGLNATPYFSTAKNAFRLNDFGGTVGGPVLRNKLFLFGYYEGVRQTSAASSFAILPTQAELAGDFSKSSTTIYDPTTYNTTTKMTQVFPGNVIPTNRLNAGILTVLKAYVPVPAAGSPAGVNNYQNTSSSTVTQNQYGIRGDYTITPNDLFYARVIVNKTASISPGQLEGNDFILNFNDKNVSMNYVHTFSPTLTAQITGGLNFFDYPLYNIQKGASDVFNAAGFSSGFTSTPGGIGLPYIPGIHPSGFFNISAGWGGEGQNQQTLEQISGTVTKQAGSHSLKFGAAYYWSGEAGNFASNDINFSQQATWNPCATTNSGSGACVGAGGNALASLLLGLPVSASRQLGNSLNVVNARILGLYAQDAWKISPKLTVNYGLRWDYTTPPTEDKNRFSGFDYRTNTWYIVPGNAATPSVLPSGVTILNRNTITTPDYKNFSPRLGISYLLFPKTVVRTGFGGFYDNWAGILQGAQNNRGAWPNGAQQSVSNVNIAGVTPNATAQNPFGSLQPIGPVTPFPSGGSFLDTKFRNANAWQWNLEIQQQVTNSGVLSVAYVGSSTARAPITRPANVARTLGPTLTIPYPQQSQFNSVESTGHMSYNALQSKYEQRYKGGLSFIGSFTYSHTIDVGCSDIFVACSIQNPYNLKSEKARSLLDVPIVLNLASVYELPFGRGKKYLSHGPASYILGNFQLNTIFITRSGTPFNPTINFDNANANGGTQRPNRVGDPNSGSKTLQRYFNTAAFATAAPYTYGNAGRNSLRGPRYTNIVFSVFRNFILPREQRVEFRADGFNILNHPNFGNPGSTLGNPNFGQITSTAGNPRQIQLALKYVF